VTKYNLLGVQVDATDYEHVVDRVVSAAREARPLSVSATAVHGVMEGFHDPRHAARLNAFDFVTPDGQPVRWALNWLYRAGLRDRVYGPELMRRVLARCGEEGLPVFWYGSTPDVLAALGARTVERFPSLIVAGMLPSRFARIEEEEQVELAERIRASGARVVLVGLGCPRQEVFVHAMRDRVGVPMLAVGAAFDFYAGRSKEAPAWMQRAGLQWLHRLAGDPRRLWRRYLVLGPAFLWHVARQRFGDERRATSPSHLTDEAIPA